MSTPSLFPTFKRRNFGRGHAYYLDGEKVDGVTTLLGDGARKKALEAWNGNVVADYAVDHWDELSQLSFSQRLDRLKKSRYEVRDEAARRGTEVHSLAEQIIKGQQVAVPDELAGHVESAVRFMDDWEVEELLVEAAGVNVEHRYGGTFDLLFRTRRFPGRTFLGDWKTSRDIYGETAMQLEAYSRFDFVVGEGGGEVPLEGFGITDHVAIHIKSDDYVVYPMQRGDDVWSRFLATAASARANRKDDIDALRGDAMYLPGVAA
ncbi:hypothetical protein [Microbacterium gilvum]|uniref:PD-(D/E)XK endonuclease-like domain-containing protein n=1 Tax=Microbacterium gilvum TaxID=1336204 RepID=A0ABP8ZQ99_9MICO